MTNGDRSPSTALHPTAMRSAGSTSTRRAGAWCRRPAMAWRWCGTPRRARSPPAPSSSTAAEARTTFFRPGSGTSLVTVADGRTWDWDLQRDRRLLTTVDGVNLGATVSAVPRRARAGWWPGRGDGPRSQWRRTSRGTDRSRRHVHTRNRGERRRDAVRGRLRRRAPRAARRDVRRRRDRHGRARRGRRRDHDRARSPRDPRRLPSSRSTDRGHR